MQLQQHRELPVQLRFAILMIAVGLLTQLFAEEQGSPLKAEPVVVQSPSAADEKSNAVPADSAPRGAALPRRPTIFTAALGLRMLPGDSTSVAHARAVATDNILRPNEVIYKGSGVTLNETMPASSLMPALRAEWEIPFENMGLMRTSRLFSLMVSFEGGYSSARSVLSSSGNFRYQNAQAAHVTLTDVTYTGGLAVSERHWNLTPMLGLGLDYSNPTLQKIQELRLLLRVSAGLALQSGQRSYDLALAPQFVSAVNDTYVIQSQIVQSYGMALLPAARAEAGFRMRLAPRLHIALLLSVSAWYGFLPWENQGYFAERAGASADRNIYQKIVSGISDQDYLGFAPAIFLALSSEL